LLESKKMNAEELDEACWPIFEKLMIELGDRYQNWLVVIEPTSSDYFLGQDDHEVLARARKRHPHGSFFAYRLNKDPVIDTL